MSETSPVRVDNPRLLRGRVNFTDDVYLDRIVHAVFVPSPMVHAEIFSIRYRTRDGSWRARRHHGGGSAVYRKKLISRFRSPAICGGRPDLIATKDDGILDGASYIRSGV